jgi:hypothetical protein
VASLPLNEFEVSVVVAGLLRLALFGGFGKECLCYPGLWDCGTRKVGWPRSDDVM